MFMMINGLPEKKTKKKKKKLNFRSSEIAEFVPFK